MKKLNFIFTMFILFNCSNPTKQSVVIPETKAFILNGKIKCEIIQETELYTRVLTEVILNEKDLRLITDSLNLSGKSVYYHIPGFTERGEEYAGFASNYMAVFGDFDTFKLKQNRTEKAVKEAEQIKRIGIRDEEFARKAFVISQDFVKAQLTFPKSADFPFLDYKFSNVIDNTIVIESYVDAKNAYNAEIRHNYSIKLKLVGSDWTTASSWKVISLEFD